MFNGSTYPDGFIDCRTREFRQRRDHENVCRFYFFPLCLDSLPFVHCDWLLRVDHPLVGSIIIRKITKKDIELECFVTSSVKSP